MGEACTLGYGIVRWDNCNIIMNAFRHYWRPIVRSMRDWIKFIAILRLHFVSPKFTLFITCNSERISVADQPKWFCQFAFYLRDLLTWLTPPGITTASPATITIEIARLFALIRVLIIFALIYMRRGIFLLISGILVTEERLNLSILFGSALITFSGLYIIWREQLLAKRPDRK